MSRRRMIQLTGAGVVAGAVATGGVAANGGNFPNAITFDGSASDGTSTYEFEVSGGIDADEGAASREDTDTIDGTRVEGSVTSAQDVYHFSGNLTHLNVDGTAAVTIQYADSGATDTDRLEIVSASEVSYTFTSTDAVEKVTDNGDYSAESGNDSVTENGDGTWTVEGYTGNGYGDAYDFRGELTQFEPVDGDYTLFLNGEEVTVTDLVDQETDEGEETDGSTGHVFEVRSTTDTPAMYYEFAVEGEVAANDSVEDHDEITQDGDVYRVSGQVGPNGDDSYEVPGKLLEWNAVDTDDNYVSESRFGLYWDDQEVSLDDIVAGGIPTQRIEMYAPEDVELDYTFTTTGEIEPVTDNGDSSAEPNYDEIVENDDGTWTVDGLTGNDYGDAFDFTGEPEDFQPRRGNFAIYLDGEQVTPWELLGEEKPEEPETVDGGPVGGGHGYENTVSRDQADYVVSSKSELGNALSSASSGDVVYVAGNATIDVGSTSYTLPRGVTLASNRGIDDAPGGLLQTDEETDMFNIRRNARVTGLRVQGPFYEYFDPSWYAEGSGLRIVEDGVEIDNCEVWGFAYAAINCRSGEPHVHHNHVHHNPRDGLGYGVIGSGGHPLIEWNYFNYNRHGVASSGNGGYTVRYNRFGPDTIDIVLDVHRPGGELTEIYNNTVEGFEEIPSGDVRPAFQMRGTPDDVAEIYNNWFYNPHEPRDSPTGGWTDEAIIQVHVEEWTNVEFWNNHYGQSEPSSDIGCPR